MAAAGVQLPSKKTIEHHDVGATHAAGIRRRNAHPLRPHTAQCGERRPRNHPAGAMSNPTSASKAPARIVARWPNQIASEALPSPAALQSSPLSCPTSPRCPLGTPAGLRHALYSAPKQCAQTVWLSPTSLLPFCTGCSGLRRLDVGRALQHCCHVNARCGRRAHKDE